MIYEFVIPAKYRALHAAGKIVRRGSLLIDPKTRKILAHLQETARAAQSVSKMGSPVSAILKAAELGTGALNTVQLEQVKKRLASIEEMLGVTQGLQVANLATSVVGIGVTAASTAIVCQRINLLRDDVTRLGKDVREFREEWRTAQLQDLLDKAMTRVERIGSVRNRNDQRSVLQEAETVLHDVFTSSLSRGKALLAMDKVPVDALQIIIEGLMISGATRVKALLLLDEAEEAKYVALKQVGCFSDLTLAMPQDALASRLTGVAKPVEVAKQVSATFSEARLQSASVPHLLEHLSSEGVQPSSFLKIVDEEKDNPFIFIPSR
jgi:hypothetical protein